MTAMAAMSRTVWRCSTEDELVSLAVAAARHPARGPRLNHSCRWSGTTKTKMTWCQYNTWKESWESVQMTEEVFVCCFFDSQELQTSDYVKTSKTSKFKFADAKLYRTLPHEPYKPCGRRRFELPGMMCLCNVHVCHHVQSMYKVCT